LLEKGVPWDVAIQNRALRDALTLIFAEMEGKKFNWNTMSFYTVS